MNKLTLREPVIIIKLKYIPLLVQLHRKVRHLRHQREPETVEYPGRKAETVEFPRRQFQK